MGRVSESKWLQSEIFWGRSIKLDVPMRITALVFTMAALASMSFAQLSFWSMGVIDGNPVYLFLTLGVLFMGAFLFGPLTGALLGLYAGAVAFAHATLLPLDYYEIYFMTPSNTFAMLTVLGALAGWLFSVALRDKPKGAARIFRIVLICVVLSFVASGIMEVSALVSYYGFKGFSSVGEALAGDAIGITLQAAIDAALGDIRRGNSGPVPRRLQNMHYDGEDNPNKGQHYIYPHDYPNHYTYQQYLPDAIKDRRYYRFGDNKNEQAFKAYWDRIKNEK